MSLEDLDIVFVIGAPRSGTTWLQNMLGSHEEIAAPPESFVFSSYVRVLEREWRKQLGLRRIGIAAALGGAHEPFERAVGVFVEEIYRSLLTLKPAARVIVDKTPDHAFFAGRIESYVPRARFIHLLRDGRDVVRSLLHASSRAPGWVSNATEAAALWASHVTFAQQPRRAPFLEIRYEELHGPRGPELLAEVLAFCGVAADREQAQAIYDRFRLDREGATGVREMRGVVTLEQGVPPWPEEFISSRRGARPELSWRQRVAVELEIGPLLRELGYAGGDWPAVGRLGLAGSHVWRAAAGALRDRVQPSLERLPFLSR